MISEDAKGMADEIRNAEAAMKKHHLPIGRMVAQFATKWFRDDLTAEPTPENHVFAWVAWMLPQLAYGAPAALVEAEWDKSHGDVAKWMEAGGRRWGKCYNPAEQFALWVRDALFSYGVLKIGLEQVDGQIRPMMVHVPMDRWGCDPRQNDHLSAAKFQYHRYDVDMSDLPSLRNVDPAALAKITDTYDAKGEKSGIGVAGQQTGDRKVFRVYDVWLPESGKIGTLLATGDKDPGDVWLRPPTKWWGPKGGPFVVLGFKSVPGSPVPCSDLQPVMQQIQALNAHLRAEAKEANSFKTGIAVDASMIDAAKGIEMGENNGVWILPGIAARPNGVQTLSLGGVHPQRLEHTDRLKERVQRFLAMGDAQLGISNSDTATANQIADQAANIRVKGMQAIVNAKASEALAGVMWWMFYDPSLEQKISFTDQSVDPLTGEERSEQVEAWMGGGTEARWYRGEFFPPMTDIAWPDDFQVTVDPESTTHTSNVQRQNDAMLILQVQQTAYQMLMTMPGADVEFAVDTVGQSMNRRNLFRSLFSPQLVAQARAGSPMMPTMLPDGASPAMGPGIQAAQGGLGGSTPMQRPFAPPAGGTAGPSRGPAGAQSSRPTRPAFGGPSRPAGAGLGRPAPQPAGM